MSVITPVTLDGLEGVPKETVTANWPNHEGRPDPHHHFEVSGRGEYETSYISCVHPAGKAWRSMFIPTNSSGSCGLSISWWGKSNFVNGQVQVKEVSESEWASTARSKLAVSGYEAHSYIGRRFPLDGKHRELAQLHNSASCPSISQLALLNHQSDSIIERKGAFGIGAVMGAAIKNIKPTGDFLNSLIEKNFNVADLVRGKIPSAKTSSSADFISSLANSMTGANFATEHKLKKEKSVPVIDRESVYGGWGAFG